MHQLIHRFGGLAKAQVARLRRRPVTEEYEAGAPSAQRSLDLFAGEWASRLPSSAPGLTAGHIPLFEDARVRWAIERLGGVQDASVLELGPLEGGHTWMLEQQGAASITAIEANRRAFLKCLVLKEVVGTSRARFLLGDFLSFLREAPDARFDVGVASGVLYHMPEPVELLARLARACDRLFLWTHYYDRDLVRRQPAVAARFRSAETRIVEGFSHTVYPHWYQAARFTPGFCGSGETHPRWMTREDIAGALRHCGHQRVEIGLEEPEHPHGPALGLVSFRQG
jgi:SAM-dependent methyltransferase